MSKFASKPRRRRSKFKDEPALADFDEGTVGWVMQRYFEEWEHRIGVSQRYTIRVLQRSPISKKMAEFLRPSDIIAHCQLRAKQPRRKGSLEFVQPQTVQQDITYLRVALDYAASGWEMPQITDKAIEDAMPKLVKFGLIAKSRPRDRRPTEDEFKRRAEYFRVRDAVSEIPMAELDEFQVWSARRISETCRILCKDVNEDKRTVIVRDMKDPKKKKGNDVEVPLLGRAWDIVAPRLAKWKSAGSPTGARIFPYRSQTASAASTYANKALGIVNLRLHDLRREAASRLFEAGYSVQEVMLVTGHKTPMLLLRVYTKLKPEDLHAGPAAKRGLKATVDTPMLMSGWNVTSAKDIIHQNTETLEQRPQA